VTLRWISAVRGPFIRIFILLLVGASGAYAHEPIFGLGPHTIFKGGIGVEAEIEGERSSGAGEVETEYVLQSEIIYGITTDLSATLAVPYVIERRICSLDSYIPQPTIFL